ncbi:MAG: hypothetical protein R2792_03935 [Saprospiraceae bacterium]
MGLIGVLLNFPTGNSRFYALSVLFLFYLVFQYKPERTGYRLLPYFAIGLLTVFWLNQFREKNFDQVSLRTVQSEQIFSGNFDAFELMTIGVSYVEDNGTSMGKNILGAILFFVPRSVWPTKPIGTGAYLVQNYTRRKGLFIYNANLSFPLAGEFYFAFGNLGIILGSLFVGFYSSLFDKFFRLNFNNKSLEFNLLLLGFGGLFSISLFNYRGDLLSSFAYLCGFLFAYYFSMRFLGFKIKMKFIRLK